FQVASLLVAYTVLLHSAVGVPRTQIFRDLGPAVLASAAMFFVGTMLTHALGTELPAAATCLVVGAAGAAIYLVALRSLSAASWSDLRTIVQRIVPRRVRKVAPLSSAS